MHIGYRDYRPNDTVRDAIQILDRRARVCGYFAEDETDLIVEGMVIPTAVLDAAAGSPTDKAITSTKTERASLPFEVAVEGKPATPKSKPKIGSIFGEADLDPRHFTFLDHRADLFFSAVEARVPRFYLHKNDALDLTFVQAVKDHKVDGAADKTGVPGVVWEVG